MWVAAILLVSAANHKATVSLYNFLPLNQQFSYLGFILSDNLISGKARHFGLPAIKFFI